MKEENRRKCKNIPFDHEFVVNGQTEWCHATGYQVFDLGVWWNEYIDSTGEFQYGN